MHWIYPSVGSAIFGFGLGGLSDVALCVTIDSYEAASSSKGSVISADLTAIRSLEKHSLA